jgi:GTPase
MNRQSDIPIDQQDDGSTGRLPRVAVVGRPNVGKSTLVNRILGRRAAITQEQPGVTRDRVTYQADWAGRRFELIDTGGWESRATGLQARVVTQAERAMADADLILFVVDATVGITEEDAAVAARLRRGQIPVLLVANKVDSAAAEPQTADLWSLGLGEPLAVSSLHGRGSGDLLDAVIERLGTVAGADDEPDVPALAIVGRPNVGKSSLLNKLAGDDLAIVDPTPGTTRDTVDSIVERAGQSYRLVDTAGMRRSFQQAEGADYFAFVRSLEAVDRADVALLVLEAPLGVAEQDQKVAVRAVETWNASCISWTGRRCCASRPVPAGGWRRSGGWSTGPSPNGPAASPPRRSTSGWGGPPSARRRPRSGAAP